MFILSGKVHKLPCGSMRLGNRCNSFLGDGVYGFYIRHPSFFRCIREVVHCLSSI